MALDFYHADDWLSGKDELKSFATLENTPEGKRRWVWNQPSKKRHPLTGSVADRFYDSRGNEYDYYLLIDRILSVDEAEDTSGRVIDMKSRLASEGRAEAVKKALDGRA